MKRLSAIWATIILVTAIVILLAGGLGFGSGSGSGSDSHKSQFAEDRKQENKETLSGQKTEETRKIVIQVSVVKNEYFYENERVELDDLMEKITTLDEKPVVQITDDDASLKAYNKLLDKLDGMDIPYVEESIY